MPRPSPWNSETGAIRLPLHTHEACLKLARELDGLDQPAANVQNPPEGWSGPHYKDIRKPGESDHDWAQRGPEQAPHNLNTKQWVEAGALVDQLWAELAHMTEDQRWYVFSRLMQEWGQAGRLPDAA